MPRLEAETSRMGQEPGREPTPYCPSFREDSPRWTAGSIEYSTDRTEPSASAIPQASGWALP
jgi:hypothetical protein